MVRWTPPSLAPASLNGLRHRPGRRVPARRPSRLRRLGATRRPAADVRADPADGVRDAEGRLLDRARRRRARAARGRVRRRERQVAARLHGGEAWLSEARTTAQVVSNRLARPEGQRFDRVSPLRYGYRIDDVDLVRRQAHPLLPRRLADLGRPGAHGRVPMQRGGYREAQVDVVLDAVVDVMLAVR